MGPESPLNRPGKTPAGRRSKHDTCNLLRLQGAGLSMLSETNN